MPLLCGFEIQLKLTNSNYKKPVLRQLPDVNNPWLNDL